MAEKPLPQSVIGKELEQLGLTGIVKEAGEGFGCWRKEVAERLNPIRREWLSHLDKLVGQSGVIHLTDAGCGNGNAVIPFLRTFAEKGHPAEAYLIDILAPAITEARQNISQAHLPHSITVTFQRGDVTNLPLPDASQEGILNNSVLGWLGTKENVEAALRNFARVLVPDGYMFLSTMTPYNTSNLINISEQSFQQRLQEVQAVINDQPEEPYIFSNTKYRDGHGQPRPVVYFTELALGKMIASAGLTVVKSELVKNTRFPNELNERDPNTNAYKYPENLNVIVQKPKSK